MRGSRGRDARRRAIVANDVGVELQVVGCAEADRGRDARRGAIIANDMGVELHQLSSSGASGVMIKDNVSNTFSWLK